jgi:uncharacterized protein with PIN domain
VSDPNFLLFYAKDHVPFKCPTCDGIVFSYSKENTDYEKKSFSKIYQCKKCNSFIGMRIGWENKLLKEYCNG